MFHLHIKIIFFRPEGPEYSSPGHSFRRNDRNDALGKDEKIKNVRDRKMTNALQYFWTELHPRNQKKSIIQPFRPKHLLFIEQNYYADDFKCTFLPRALPGAIVIFPLQGKRKLYLYQIS